MGTAVEGSTYMDVLGGLSLEKGERWFTSGEKKMLDEKLSRRRRLSIINIWARQDRRAIYGGPDGRGRRESS
jgi:hypothetical protein